MYFKKLKKYNIREVLKPLEETKFNTFVPLDLEKSVDSETDTNKYSVVTGWASTPNLDLQNDIVSPKGIDIEYFKKHGYINYEHQSDEIVGIPTDECYVDMNKGLYIEAKLFKDNDKVIKMLDLAEKLQKSGSGRRLGFSIEGAIKSRNVNDNRIIDSVMISGVALTAHPANPEATWEKFVKSFVTGYGITPDTQQDAGALRREQIAGSISNLTYSTSLKNPEDLSNLWNDVVNYMSKNNQLGYEESIVTLQLAKGLSRTDAEKAVLDIRRNELDS